MGGGNFGWVEYIGRTVERIGEVVELIGVVKFDGGMMYLHIGLEGMLDRELAGLGI